MSACMCACMCARMCFKTCMSAFMFSKTCVCAHMCTCMCSQTRLCARMGNTSPEVFFNRINPLAMGVAPAKVCGGTTLAGEDQFSWGCPFDGSQLNCHNRSGTGKLSYSSASVPRRLHFSWGHTLN